MSGFKMSRPQVDTHRSYGGSAVQPRPWRNRAQRTPSCKRVVFYVSRRVAMVLGMTLATYTLIHVIISLVAIASGLIVFIGMSANKRMDGLTALFLATTVLTSVTGFFFPFAHVTPGIILGVLSLVVLVIAIPARYAKHLARGWRKTYIITSGIALWFNMFVLVVQSFQKVPSLHALAPTQKEPPFGIAQLVVLLVVASLTFAAAKRFRQEPAAIAKKVAG